MLMLHRTYPGEAVDCADAWVAEKRKEKEEEEQKKSVHIGAFEPGKQSELI
jgi:hypothetical protein